MDFITSIKQLSIHLTNLENNQFIDESLLEENKRNLSNSLIESDPCLEDHSVSKFFLQLHQLTEASCRNGKSFRPLLLILNELVENPKTRSHLQQLDFIPLLANATEIEDSEDLLSILRILDKLTKRCRIETPELFLITFIPFLVTSIESCEPEKLQSRLCLSVLINLCESRPGMDTLLKFCSSKELSKKFQSFGFLTLKIHYLIESFYNKMKHLEFTASSVFSEIYKLIAEQDSKMCLECFSFIEEFSKPALEICRATFEEELGKLLERLMELLKSGDSWAEAIVAGGLNMYASLIKNNNSLTIFHEPLLDFALESFCRDSAFYVNALNLLESLGVKNSRLESSECLLSVWMDLAKAHQASILNCVNRMSLHELLVTPDDLKVERMKDDHILLILMTLELLATFATVEPQEWYGQIDEAFKRPDIVEIMAEGFVRKNEEMFRCCLDLAKFTNFPTKKITTILHESPARMRKEIRQLPPEETFSPLRVLQRQSDEIDRSNQEKRSHPAFGREDEGVRKHKGKDSPSYEWFMMTIQVKIHIMFN
ncbi:uncharacterized protein LOC129800989 [Phlebotomus papatasi]|uniref:uncharacterized protein LOC129800989 n=1 Tax=Phlebotomus papatasi TaxID=29031 RepID=UPI00248398B9|nr:uncharacterized protein LOC129800989 [Phlebotomus papatasi]